MSKYCILKDRPFYRLTATNESILTGCEIYGVHHKCEGCPNLMEMGDESYTFSNSIETKQEWEGQDEEHKKEIPRRIRLYVEELLEGDDYRRLKIKITDKYITTDSEL